MFICLPDLFFHQKDSAINEHNESQLQTDERSHS